MTPTQSNTDEARWNAFSENNSSADGAFYYAVITTGIYCRRVSPRCSAKL